MLEILRFFLLSTDPAFIVPEVADEFGVTDATARTRMNKMVEEGYLKKKKTGSRACYTGRLTKDSGTMFRKRRSSNRPRSRTAPSGDRAS